MTVGTDTPQMKERRIEMKLIPVGIARDGSTIPLRMRAEDYGDRMYDGVQLRSDGKKNPVVILHCKRNDPLRWKVVYGFSQVFFRSFADAVKFCNSRGFQLVKEQVDG